MLTKDDFRLLEKLFDKKLKSLKTDVAAIETRVADLETGKITKLDFYEVKNALYKIEKRMAAYEARLAKIEISMATKDDMKKEFRGVVKRKDLLPMERRLTRSINRLTDVIDNKFMNIEERLDDVERRLSLPVST